MADKYTKRLEGFTLVELSIVIIIIGFLVAGISAGQSLIKQAQLASVINEFQGYKLAYDTFIMRYYGVPGNISNASAFWPDDGTCAETAALCDGSNNGVIHNGKEEHAAWKELSLAGLINTNIPIITATTNVFTQGVDAPVSKIDTNNSGYVMTGDAYIGIQIGWFIWWSSYDKNWLYLGSPGAQGFTGAILKPAQAFSIDQKIDNAAVDASGNFSGANTGNFRASNGGFGSGAYGVGGDCATGNLSFGGYGNNYSVGYDAFVCLPAMLLDDH